METRRGIGDRRFPGLAWLGLLLLVPVACSDSVSPGDAADPITELPRELTVAEEALIGASNGFGLELVARVLATDDRPNVILSPLSASMALGMTLNGADGSTFDGMRSTLGFDGLTQAEINASYRGLLDLLTTLDPAVQFEIANSIWANEGVPFHQAFFDAVRAAFDATVESRDFGDPATLTAINTWVEENTGGLIDSIVDRLDPALVMLLVNAIYLDAAWTDPFDPDDTYPADFTRDDASTVTVDMMSRTDVDILTATGPDYTAVELPYGGQAFSMVVLLPSGASTAREVLAGLDADAWAALTSDFGEQRYSRLALPKFTVTYDGFLNDALAAMGMEVAFTPAADFSRLSPDGEEMCISFVRQKTYMEVDERGTRAAAVTAVGIVETSLPPELVVDRPFGIAIRERLSGTLLFAGVVGDPTADDPGAIDPTVACG